MIGAGVAGLSTDTAGVETSSGSGRPLAEASEADLAVACGMGDREAFAEIFHRHAAGMYRYALRMLEGDHQGAEDAVQDALAKAWTGLATFEGRSSLNTWLFRLTANEVLAARRRRRPEPVDHRVLERVGGADRQGPETVVARAQLAEALDAALTELPWRQRASWLLREVEEMSYQDIAQIMRTSPTVVRGQLHRARRTLAVRMGQWR